MTRKFFITSFATSHVAMERVGALGARAVGPARNTREEAASDVAYLTANPATARVKRA